MHIVYAFEEAPQSYAKSLFLAGPTPRDEQTLSWRPEALRLLEKSGYDGVVFVPEARDKTWRSDYDGQIAWEDKHLHMADCILFWVPRELKSMPAFTTNDEWGTWKYSGKCVFGAPTNASKTNYQRHYAKKLGVPTAQTLQDTIALALTMLSDGRERMGGEREVPLYIWRTQHFQSWYQAQKNAGNRLDGAEVTVLRWVGPKGKPFLIAVRPTIFNPNEQRSHSNETVIIRPDIATMVLYCPGKTAHKTMVAIVREFRVASSGADGLVWEVPGGSSFTPMEPILLAIAETDEEVGLRFPEKRVRKVSSRQLAGTLSSHKADCFAVKLNVRELKWLKEESRKKIPHGEQDSGERTYIEVLTVAELLDSPNPDWTTIGMVMSAIA